jgi:hypothetical protein
MKRIFFLMCALLLLADLADDGFLGKVPALLPQCPGNISFTTSPYSSGNNAPQVSLPLGELRVILQHWQNQLVFVEVGNILAKIDCCLLGSSGGLPL